MAFFWRMSLVQPCFARFWWLSLQHLKLHVLAAMPKVQNQNGTAPGQQRAAIEGREAKWEAFHRQNTDVSAMPMSTIWQAGDSSDIWIHVVRLLELWQPWAVAPLRHAGYSVHIACTLVRSCRYLDKLGSQKRAPRYTFSRSESDSPLLSADC